jgi:hypothetical protein
MLECAGATRVLTMDLHAGQIQGFFTIPVDHMTALPLLAEHFRERCAHEEVVVVSPDTPGERSSPADSRGCSTSLSSCSTATAALPGWLDFYNLRRPHGSLSHQPPTSRHLELMNNLPGNYG